MTALRRWLPICALWCVFAASASPAPTEALSADVAPQPLAQALTAFANQTGLQLVYVSEMVGTRQTKGASAGVSLTAALTQLLDGTGLQFEFINARTVRIHTPPAAVPAVASSAAAHRDAKASQRSIPLALEQIVITATRRDELLNQVPISAAVWTRDEIEASGIKGIAQLSALTPGLEFNVRPNLGGDLYTSLGIRGVDNRHGAVAGIYLDDAEIPPLRLATYMRPFPPTFDVDRVEVLRGPQSTLLGGHTQAGAVRFFTIQPSLTEFSAGARTEWATTAHGDTSYEMGAAAGGPLVSDVLGFRVSGWYRTDGGYVDRVDPVTGAIVDANSNSYVTRTMRGALTFVPTGGVRLTPSLTYQSTGVNDSSSFDGKRSNPSSGDFRSIHLLEQPFDDSFYLPSLKVTADLRFGELTALTSYLDRTTTATLDASDYPPTSHTDPLAWDAAIAQRILAQQVQLASTDPNAALTWIAGALYSHEHAHHFQSGLANGLSPAPNSLDLEQGELDEFGEIEVKLPKHLALSGGLRIGHSTYDYATDPSSVFQGSASDTWMAPRLVLSCQFDENNMFYLSAAKGYGRSAIDPGIDSFFFEPVPTRPDALWSYEIGSKSDLWDGRLHLDASVFHVQWNNGWPDRSFDDSEVALVPGTAVSNGIDVALHALLTEHVTVAVEAEYADPHFTSTVETSSAELGQVVWVRNGDGTAERPWSATASIERTFFLRGNVSATLRVEDACTSCGDTSRHPYYSNPQAKYYSPGPADPAINVLNFLADMKWPHFDAEIFVSNALDAHPVLARGTYGYLGDQPETITPRTLSISGSWRF